MKGSANKQNTHSCGNKWQKLHQGNLQRENSYVEESFMQYKQNKLKIVFVPQNMKNSSLSSVRVFLNKKYNNNHNKKLLA